MKGKGGTESSNWVCCTILHHWLRNKRSLIAHESLRALSISVHTTQPRMKTQYNTCNLNILLLKSHAPKENSIYNYFLSPKFSVLQTWPLKTGILLSKGIVEQNFNLNVIYRTTNLLNFSGAVIISYISFCFLCIKVSIIHYTFWISQYSCVVWNAKPVKCFLLNGK